MADQKISAMIAAASVGDADLVPIVQAGVNKRATVAQILDGVVTELDATLEALALLDSSTGLVEQTGADAFTKRALGVAASTSVPTRADADTRYAAASHTHAAADLTALRTFVRPPGNVGSAGGFYQQNLFGIAIPTPDALAGRVDINVKIIDATKSGSYYYDAPFLITRSSLADASLVPSGFVRAQYLGDSGTSIGVVQLSVGAANGVLLFLIQPLGFTSPVVTMTAVMILPGTNTVTIV